MLVQATGDYLDTLLAMSFWTGVNTDYQWQFDWTVFYWGWWISWASFVGMFIARVSKGRTIREFVFGVRSHHGFSASSWDWVVVH